MNYKTILRHQPWLRFINYHNISSRLLDYTKGDIFIAFNRLSQLYEVHSVKSYYISGFSQNAVIEPEFLNGFIYTDYRSTEFRKFLFDIQDQREMINHLYTKDNREAVLKDQMRVIERTIGTKI